jgi:WD40 repeat protein
MGRGGMGVVYTARQISLHRVVALKMTLAGPLAHPQAVQRFRAEAETIAGLRHEHIVSVHEVGEADGRLFFSMDYIPGASLAAVAREKPMPAREAATHLQKIAEAVAYAHSYDVIHRDLKPSNILIDERGQPRITDFGLAKTLSDDSEMTLSGQALGSPSFCAPEQAAGRRGEISARSDLYSLGAILYFVLTGRPPLLGETLEQTLWLVLNTEPVAPRLLNPGVPADLETICLRCLEKNPARRYATARELADELGRFLREEPIQARPVSAVEKSWRWCRRNPALATALAGVMTLLTTVAVIISVASVRLARKEVALRHGTYAAEMRLAQRAIDSDNLGLANHFLNHYRPPHGHSSLRGWEWRYFWGQSRPEALFRVGRHHRRRVSALAFSADGSRLASADSTGEVKLWDLAARNETATGRHPASIDALDFSADGRVLASAGVGGEIRLWDGTTLRQSSEPLRQDNQIVALRFTLDGKRLIAVALDPAAGWMGARATTWNLAGRQKEHEQEIRTAGRAAVSPDGLRIATGGVNGEIWLWHLASASERTGEEGEGGKGELPHAPSPAFPPAHSIPRTLASESAPFKEMARAHSSRVMALAFSPDGNRLASGGFDRVAKVWDTRTGAELTAVGGFNGMVSGVAFSPDGNILAAASDDQAVRLWDSSTWQEMATLRGHMSGISSLAFSPKGDLVVTGGKGGEIRAWNPFLKLSRTGFHRLPTRGKVSVAGASTALITMPTALSLIELTNGLERMRFDVAGLNVSAVAASPDARWIAAGTWEGDVRLWNATGSVNGIGNSGRISIDVTGTNKLPIPLTDPVRIQVGTTAVSALEFSADARLLAAAIANRHVQIVDVRRGQVIARLDEKGASIADFEFSPDGRWLAVGHEDGTTVLWHVVERKVLRRFERHDLGVTAVAFSPDGRTLATTSDDATVILWDTASARRFSTLRGLGSALWSVCWSPDGRRLAIGTGESTVAVWDLASGQDVATLRGHTHSIIRAHFLPDGNTLATYAFDELFLWRAPPLSEID